ncbi:fasciclin domain-containing protein [Paraflavisolibacter sp. H34]|uniref:fasciclin domain-containing protein n=1 Tax=Huijunlia imazamoxiresistens TaxID=3127457 RepID=UPI003018BE27
MFQLLQRKRFAINLPLLLFFLSLLAAACQKGYKEYYGGENPKGGFLYNKIKDNPSFSQFSRGLERADLVKYINQGGLYTVFAPTNEAFDTYLKANNYNTIDDVPVDRLFTVLSFHIVNNMWYYYDLKTRFATNKQTLYLTRNKKFLNIDVTAADTIKANGIPVVNSLRDIDAENGVIHGIGQVLVPLPSLEDVLQGDPALKNSTFYRLMQVLADKAYDRFNSYDKDRDGQLDSMFYKVYPLLTNVNTSIEFKQNTAVDNQGGDPVFNTILVPSDDSLNAQIAPALARIDNNVTDKIAALSPAYVEAVLKSYFIYDTSRTYSAEALINRPATPILRSVNSEALPALSDAQFLRKDIPASNGVIHLINRTFPASEQLRSALGQASMDPQLSQFMMALQKAGLMGTYENLARAGTYLAPTNAAFAAAGIDAKTQTMFGSGISNTDFALLVKNHIIESNLAPSGLTGTKVTAAAAPYQLVFTNGGATVTTNTGLVATVQLPEATKGANNVGYVYKVDKVLFPK